jgi:hypothetical protein
MVVPHGDPNKVRVTGYHILFELDNESWSKLKANQPMTKNPGAAKLLGKAMAGEHPPRIEEVRIHGQHGTNVKITPYKEKGSQPKKVAPAKALDDTPEIEAVDVQEVAEKTRAQQAEELMLKAINNNDPKAANELLALKRRTKVSWGSLNIRSEEAERVKQIAATAPVENNNDELLLTEVVQPAPIQPPKDQVEVAKEIVSKVPSKKKASKPASKAPEPTPAAPKGNAARIVELITVIHDGKDATHMAAAARELLDIRRKVKKSWAKLGHPEMNDEELRRIVNANIDVAPPKKATPLPPKAEKAIQETKAAGKAAKEKKASQPAPKAKEPSRQERARALFEKQDWAGLAAFKKKAKVGWEQLGFTTGEVGTIKLHQGD